LGQTQGLEANCGSLAEAELAALLFPARDPDSLTDAERNAGGFPKESDNPFLVNHPRSAASLHVRVGADYLAGEAALIRSGELIFPPLSMARIALEHAVRAITLLDPSIRQEQRCARALAEDVVSAHFERVAWKHLVGTGNEYYKRGNELFKGLREQAQRCFETDFSGGSPHDWTIGGESAIRPTDAG